MRLAMVKAVCKIVAHNSGWGVLHDGIVSGSYNTKEAALEAVVDRAAALISLADRTPDEKEGAALLELAAEEIELAESEIATQQHQQAYPKKV
jgi:hypothetical protein